VVAVGLNQEATRVESAEVGAVEVNLIVFGLIVLIGERGCPGTIRPDSVGSFKCVSHDGTIDALGRGSRPDVPNRPL